MDGTTTQHEIRNGINVTQLRDAMESIAADAGAGQTHWRVRSEWLGGTRTEHQIDGFTIGGQFVERPFTIHINEPEQLTGTNQFANPQEHLLAALNACMMVGYSAVAALMGIELESLEVETTGDIDLRGFLGLSDDVAPGYPRLQQEVRIQSGAPRERLEELHDIVRNTSPNFFNLTREVRIDSSLAQA